MAIDWAGGIGGGLSGAAAGSAIFPGIGTFIGGALGLGSGLFGSPEAPEYEPTEVERAFQDYALDRVKASKATKAAALAKFKNYAQSGNRGAGEAWLESQKDVPVTTKMLKRIIANLEEGGYLFSRIKNDNSYDRSKSYTLSTEALEIFNINRTQKQETSIIPNRQMENSKQANDIIPNGSMLDYTDISTFIIHNNTGSANAQQRNSSNNSKPSNLEEEPLKEKAHRADVLQKSVISGQAVAEHLGLSNRHDLIKAFDAYLDYRKEMRFKKYATVQTAATGMKLLKECAERSNCKPMQIVDQTRANLWQGLQDLKRAQQHKPKTNEWDGKRIPAYAPDHEQPF